MTTGAAGRQRSGRIRRTEPAARGPAAVLFLAMFAAQASLLVVTPILPAMAAELGVSTAIAAQLRSLSGVVAGASALWLGIRARARPLHDQLLVGLALLIVATATSAAAPNFVVLAVAQAVLGGGLGLVLSSALAAAGEWAPEHASSTLSWALAGQPVAWIVGMPVAGVAAAIDWRIAWLIVPTLAGVAAFWSLARRPRDANLVDVSDEPPFWRHEGAAAWVTGELLAYGAWAGTLIFVGALFIDTYATSTTVVGLVLAAGAAAYVPGNFLARRLVGGRSATLLVAAAGTSAIGTAILGVSRPSPWASALVFAALAFVAGARTLAGSSRGLSIAPACRLQAMSIRTAAVQLGYLLGAMIGGAALQWRGYPALGLSLAALYLCSAGAHATALQRRPLA